jgi:hypothetical protein
MVPAQKLFVSLWKRADEWWAADSGNRLQDGGIIANNPTGIALQEAKRLYPGVPVDCACVAAWLHGADGGGAGVVSLGTGMTRVRMWTTPPLVLASQANV